MGLAVGSSNCVRLLLCSLRKDNGDDVELGTVTHNNFSSIALNLGVVNVSVSPSESLKKN